MKPSTLCSTLLLAATASPAIAASFAPFDARSFAMGGTGVASARFGGASGFNPALLAAQPDKDRFGLALPAIGLTINDEKEVFEKGQDIQDGSLSNLNNAIAAFKANPDSSTGGAVDSAAQVFSSDLTTLSDAPVSATAGIGFNFAAPGKNLGWAVFANGQAEIGGQFNYSSSDAATLAALGSIVNDGSLDGTEYSDYSDSNGLGNPKIFTDGCTGPDYTPCLKDPESLTTSTVEVVGVSIGEIGISLSHELEGGISIGLTPKMRRITTALYERSAGNSDSTTPDVFDAHNIKEYTEFNLDAGALLHFGDKKQWQAGVVIKNFIAKKYDTISSSAGEPYQVSLKPQARAGIASTHGKLNWAADVDLTKNTSVSPFTKGTQYLGIGGEIDLRYLQLRAGYRQNLVSGDSKGMATAGIGVGPLDISAQFGSNSAGIMAQLGFSF